MYSSKDNVYNTVTYSDVVKKVKFVKKSFPSGSRNLVMKHGLNECSNTNDNSLSISNDKQYPTRTFYRKDLNPGQIKSSSIQTILGCF